MPSYRFIACHTEYRYISDLSLYRHTVSYRLNEHRAPRNLRALLLDQNVLETWEQQHVTRALPSSARSHASTRCGVRAGSRQEPVTSNASVPFHPVQINAFETWERQHVTMHHPVLVSYRTPGRRHFRPTSLSGSTTTTSAQNPTKTSVPSYLVEFL